MSTNDILIQTETNRKCEQILFTDIYPQQEQLSQVPQRFHQTCDEGALSEKGTRVLGPAASHCESGGDKFAREGKPKQRDEVFHGAQRRNCSHVIRTVFWKLSVSPNSSVSLIIFRKFFTKLNFCGYQEHFQVSHK